MKKLLEKKIFKWIGIGVLVILVFALLSGGNSNQQNKSSVSPTAEKKQAEVEKPIAVGIVGGDDLDELSDNRVNVFASPERKKIAGKIPNRSKVEVYEEKDMGDYKVYRIKYKDIEGWVGPYVLKITEKK